MNCEQTIDITESVARSFHDDSVNMLAWLEKLTQLSSLIPVGTDDWSVKIIRSTNVVYVKSPYGTSRPVRGRRVGVEMPDGSICIVRPVRDGVAPKKHRYFTSKRCSKKDAARVADRKEAEPKVPVGESD